MKAKIYNLSLKTIAILATIILLYGIALNAQETVTDYDGNIYQTVTIGTQVWMKENLKTTHYRNGDVIPNVSEASAWYGLTSGAYINYNNDSSNVFIYGRLYNWYAVTNSNNICPTDWHIPNNTEWTTLFNYLGGDNIAGGKMKEVGTSNWTVPNTGADNSSGFSALPAGYCGYEEPFFGDIRKAGFWWSVTQHDDANARIYNNSYNYINAGHYDGSKKYGVSVRCLKDGAVGIKNLNKETHFKIYPSPTTGIFNISFGATLIQQAFVEIFNLQGNLVLSETFYNTTTVTIDLTGYPAGMYLVKVVANGETYKDMIYKK